MPLPETLIPSLKEQIAEAARLLVADLADGFGEVSMPESLVRKYPNDMSRKMLVDLTMPWDRLRFSRLRIVVPVVATSVTQ